MKKLAIIGAGIAGLGCAYKLKDHYDLTIFESNDYLGGHTNTIDVQSESECVSFDTGFMVYNQRTYPNLTALLAELKVPVKATDMSFSVQYLPQAIAWNGAGLNRIFAQRKNILNFRFWHMLLKLNWFNKNAVLSLVSPGVSDMSVQDYVAHFKLGVDFLNWYLIPMGGAVWSTPPDKMLNFPMSTLIRFFDNHGFLGLDTHFQWYTVDGGARNYVNALRRSLKSVSIYSAATEVERTSRGGRVTSAGISHDFDKVILACHADQALALLAEPTGLERDLLSVFEYQNNEVTVHTDRSVMPREKLAWASWNYRVGESDELSFFGSSSTTATPGASSTTHYWMNNLQGLQADKDYFVSLNSKSLIDPSKIVRTLEYTHPLFDLATSAAQEHLPLLNKISDDQSVYFCGSYFRYGFHEDALTSAIDLAKVILQKSAVAAL